MTLARSGFPVPAPGQATDRCTDQEATVFAWWSSTVIRVRWLVLAAGLAVAVVGAVWGSGAFASLTNGGVGGPARPPAGGQQIAPPPGPPGPGLVGLLFPPRPPVGHPPGPRPVR